MTDLVGREAEQTSLRAVLAETGRNRVCVVLGDLGTGKTALLRYTAGHAAALGVPVLTCAGSDEQPLAALGGTTSFGEAAVQAFVASAPVAVLVDDAHLLDPAALRALGLLARRIGHSRVTLVIAARGHAMPPGLDPGLPTTRLGPLAPDASARLLDALPGAPTGRQRQKVLRFAEGNPRAIAEFSCWHRQARIIGGPFQDALRTLPDHTRTLLLHAAVALGPADVAEVAAATGRPLSLAGWEPAENAGIVTVIGAHATFQHPLARAAVLSSSPPGAALNGVHAALAEVVRADPVRRAWYLAGTGTALDDERAALLDDAAGLAAVHDGHFEAACAWLTAAECSTDATSAGRRYVKALAAASQLGDPGWIDQLHDLVRATTEDPDCLAVANFAAARADSHLGRQRAAFDAISPSLREPHHQLTTPVLLSQCAGIAYQSGLPEHRAELIRQLQFTGRRVLRTGDGHLDLSSSDAEDVGMLFVTAAARPGESAAILLRHFARGGPPVPSIARLLALGGTAWFADELDLCADMFRRAFDRLRERGHYGPFLDCFGIMISALIDTGRWHEADTMIDHAHAVARLVRSTRLLVEVTTQQALLSAYRGDAATADRLLDGVWDVVDLTENRAAHALLLTSAGVTDLVARREEDAFNRLRELYGPDGSSLHYFLSPRAVGHFAIAAWRTGRTEEGTLVLDRVRADLGAQTTPRPTVLLHHAAALLGPDEQAQHQFHESVEHPDAARWPMSRALALMHYSEWLRRQRRPVEARPLLIEAADSFSQLGAVELERRVRDHLRAAGAAAQPPERANLEDLSDQQRRVVRLAATGLRNQDIADRLFLSPRTVASHLYAAYARLGISGRRQLRDVLGDTTP